jgi:hypothetical protein
MKNTSKQEELKEELRSEDHKSRVSSSRKEKTFGKRINKQWNFGVMEWNRSNRSEWILSL